MGDAGQQVEILDISQRISTATPVWPGDTRYAIDRTWVIDEQCPVLVSRIAMSTHTGTHADAPSHYEADGGDIASVELHPYLGPCVVVNAPGDAGLVGPEDVLPELERIDRAPERVLVRTFGRFPQDAWPESFRALSPGLIESLGERGCRLIGTDAPSIDPETSKTLDAHHTVRRYRMSILEGLVLDRVEPGSYELIALPLRLDEADASPVRAVLRRAAASS